MAVTEFELPIAGRAISSVEVSRFVPKLRLHMLGHWIPDSTTGPDFTLTIDGPFRLISPTREMSLDPQAGHDPAYLELVTKMISRAVASQDGSLVVEFSDATRLVIAAHDEWEPWELSGESGMWFVSVAGGALAWDPELSGLPADE